MNIQFRRRNFYLIVFSIYLLVLPIYVYLWIVYYNGILTFSNLKLSLTTLLFPGGDQIKNFKQFMSENIRSMSFREYQQ